MRLSIFTVCLLLFNITQAQYYKKWSLKPLGLFMDPTFEVKNSESNFMGNCIALDKLISPSVAIGLNFYNYFNSSSAGLSGYSGYNPTISLPGYSFNSAAYNAKIKGLSISGKYFFNEADEDGQRSFYVGSEFGILVMNASLTDITFTNDSINWVNYEQKVADRQQKLFTSKIGARLGYCGTGGVISSDFSIAYFANTLMSTEEWMLPKKPESSVIQITWLIGFNF